MTSDTDVPPQVPTVGPGSITETYRNYVIVILLLCNVLNYLDRQIVNILVEPIKHDLHLSDWQVGMMTGLSFAFFYSILGIPIAAMADRYNRAKIIAASVAVWSAFTFACGFAQNFLQIFLTRVGVGCGEGGATPPSHSLVAELTTPQNRSSALAVLSLGPPIGALIGLGAGGLLGEAFGWRAAFFIAAVPGLVLAVVILLTIREPRTTRPKVKAHPPLSQSLAMLRGKRSFWWISAAAAASAFVVYGQTAFYSSFFLLHYGKQMSGFGWVIGPLGIVGIGLGVTRGFGGIFGTVLGGAVGDRLVKRDPRAYCLLPAYAMFFAGPACAAVMLAPDFWTAALALLIPSILNGAIQGPAYAGIQTVVPPHARATASAMMLFVTNMIGLSLGPLAVGALSDLFQHWVPRATALQYAMISICPVMLLSGLFFVLAHRRMGDDLELGQQVA